MHLVDATVKPMRPFLRGFGLVLSTCLLVPVVGISIVPVTSRGDGATKDGRRTTAAPHAELRRAPTPVVPVTSRGDGVTEDGRRTTAAPHAELRRVPTPVVPVTSHGDGVTKGGRRTTAAPHAELRRVTTPAGMPGRPAAVGLPVVPVTSHGDGATKDGHRTTAAPHAELRRVPTLTRMPGRPADPPHGPVDDKATQARGLLASHPPRWLTKLKRRARWRQPTRHIGIRGFFASGALHDWLLLLGCFVLFALVFLFMRCGNYRAGIPSSIVMVVLWNVVALWFHYHVIYYGAPGVDWYNGYILELVFSLENVFIFSSILGMFQVPEELVPTMLFVVVCWQNLCGVLLYIGLASALQAIQVLPYLLGLWLLFVGVSMLLHDDSEPHDLDDSRVVRCLESCLGDRFTRDYGAGFCLCVSDGGKYRLCMLAPALCVMLLLDLLMELDVSLTKISEIDSHFIAFTSSALASFAMPDLYTIFTACFQEFHLLRYGISAVMLYFGGELLLHRVVSVPDIFNIILMVAAIVLSMALSRCIPNSHKDKEAAGEA